MFPTAHYGNPESYAGFTSADCRKELFSGKDKSMALRNKYHIFLHMRQAYRGDIHKELASFSKDAMLL